MTVPQNSIWLTRAAHKVFARGKSRRAALDRQDTFARSSSSNSTWYPAGFFDDEGKREFINRVVTGSGVAELAQWN